MIHVVCSFTAVPISTCVPCTGTYSQTKHYAAENCLMGKTSVHQTPL